MREILKDIVRRVRRERVRRRDLNLCPDRGSGTVRVSPHGSLQELASEAAGMAPATV